jgi:tRNA (cytidine56-2'-O)-methyltransferase
VARAFGADEGVLCGDEDASVLQGIARVSELWGGKFNVVYENDWKRFVGGRKRDGWKVAHLTMYGEDFAVGARKLRASRKNLLVLVGAGKVPREAYGLADFNLAVGNQPHSEVAALGMFLDRFFSGKELVKKFGGKLKIKPDRCGKVVVRV